MRLRVHAAVILGIASIAAAACKGAPQRFTTTVEVMQVQALGQAATGSGLMDLELKYVDCPGNVRRVMRADKTFSAACGAKIKAGDKLKAEMVLAYNAERGQYRDDLVHLGDCDVKLDPKDEANYTMVENCADLKASGAVVGVRCDRRRTDELVAACPWLRRN